MHARTVLGNGLRILTCPMPHVRSVTLCFYIGTGSRFEAAERAGLSHFLEHMVFKGTPSYPTARHISEAIEGVGGVLDATTSAEVTAYWAKVPHQHFSRALHVLGEMLLSPLLVPLEIEKERRIIIEELHMITDSPMDWIFDLIAQAIWPGHALGRDVAGTVESVAAMQREDLQSYREQRYVPERIVAVVAGALSAEQVEAALTPVFGEIPPYPFARDNASLPLVTEPLVLLRRRETEQAHLCLAVPALSYTHPDRYVQLLLNTMLGAGMSSRLFQSMREERALAYNIYSSLRQHADTGALVIYAGVDPERIQESLATIWMELERLAQEGVSEEELERSKEYNKGRILLRMEDSYGVASWYGGQELLLKKIEEVDQVIAQIEAVQPTQVADLAETLFRREQLRLAVVGPFENDESLRQALGLQ